MGLNPIELKQIENCLSSATAFDSFSHIFAPGNAIVPGSFHGAFYLQYVFLFQVEIKFSHD